MTKEQYIDQYLDRYEQSHPDERIDYDALREKADLAWYDEQVEHDNATEYDLTAEQEKTAAEMRKGARAVNAYGKEVKRTRKANEAKRELVRVLAEAMTPYGGAITNPERTVDFVWQGKAYTWTLTEHRPPKSKS